VKKEKKKIVLLSDQQQPEMESSLKADFESNKNRPHLVPRFGLCNYFAKKWAGLHFG
jgi:hypothetical protein